jgi:prepilin-type N-terminal cleavage/methylation domain-containing protein
VTNILRRARARARAAHARREQRGFTITEVVVVVVVMGLVIAPIALGVTQALQLTPDAGARTKVAADTSLLADRFNADIASSSLASGIQTATGKTLPRDVACGEATQARFLEPENTWFTLTMDTTLKSSAAVIVSYHVVWTSVTGGQQFVVTRTDYTGGSFHVTKMLTGYCATNDKVATITNVAKGGGSGSANRRVSMSIWVRRTISSPPTVVTLNAAVRDTDV